jgi:hypothetical protein
MAQLACLANAGEQNKRLDNNLSLKPILEGLGLDDRRGRIYIMSSRMVAANAPDGKAKSRGSSVGRAED